MGFTNFPFGITSFGVPTMGMASIPPTSGRVWFVNSNTGLDGNAGSFAQPLATTARAIVLASAGDVIVWMAGHAEKITAAGSITVNNNGLTFWGLGEGKTAPTFTSTTSTAATFLISAANTVIGGNVNAICNIASQVTFFSVTAANVSIDVTIYDTSATVGLLSDVVATSAAANLTLNIDHVGFTASVLGTSMIILTGVVNGNITVNAYGAWATAVVDFARRLALISRSRAIFTTTLERCHTMSSIRSQARRGLSMASMASAIIPSRVVPGRLWRRSCRPH